MSQLLSYQAIAGLWGMNPNYLRDVIAKEPTFPKPVLIGKRHKFLASDIEVYMKARQIKTVRGDTKGI